MRFFLKNTSLNVSYGSFLYSEIIIKTKQGDETEAGRKYRTYPCSNKDSREAIGEGETIISTGIPGGKGRLFVTMSSNAFD